jgi:isocitrate lyase
MANHYKKGVQYSHYTGSDRMEISSLAWLIANTTDLNEIKQYAKQIQTHVSNLTDTIAALDNLNDMEP